MKASQVFSNDYLNLASTIAVAEKLAKEAKASMTVYKHPTRYNYNICHTSRKDLYRPEWVEHTTK